MNTRDGVRLVAVILTAIAAGRLEAADLIGHWDFAASNSATVPDLSGHGRDAAMRLGPQSTDAPAKAIVLDGYFAHGEIKDSRQMTFPHGVTISAWICPSRLKRNHMVFGTPNSNPAWTTPTLGLFAPEAGRMGFAIWTQPKTVLVSPQPTPLKTWTFIVGSYDNRMARLYIDGTCVDEEPCDRPIPASDAPLLIGTGTMSNHFFGGMIGELRLYEGALDASEVKKLYADSTARFPRTLEPSGEEHHHVTVQSKRKPDDAWRDYATRTLDELSDYARSTQPCALSKYGGWLEKRTDATGFFRAERINGRWWLIDPEGYYFIHVGVCSVTPGTSANMKRSFKQRFGDGEHWAAETAKVLRSHHFNGTGGWTANELFRSAEAPFPYLVRMRCMSEFGRRLGVTHQVPGHTGFELQCIPVFHPEFPEFCEQQARELTAYRNDPYVIGISSDNELQTPKLDNYLKLDPTNPAQKPNYDAAVKWLQARKGKSEVSSEDITVMDRMEFAGYVFERYFEIVSKAIKTYAPNHLYVGSRFMRPNFVNPFIWKAASSYCDIVTVNYYSTWGPDLDEVAYWQSLCPRPIMITEFYVKGQDSGLPNKTGAGWIVPTQTDRGRFYQHFALGLLESRNCVGWHWFKYQDNDPAQTNAEPSNIDSNKGIVNIHYDPYVPFVELMKAVNREVYPLTEFFDADDPR